MTCPSMNLGACEDFMNQFLDKQMLSVNKYCSLKNSLLLSLIIPSYNERANLQDLIYRIMATLAPINFEVTIVDDNSPDGTGEMVDALKETYPNLSLLKRSGKFGLSSAIIDGFRNSAPHSQILAVMDADLQHPPELLLKMYEEIVNGNDLVVASRYVPGGSAAGMTAYRQLISIVATLIARTTFPKKKLVADSMSGFFMLRREILFGIELNPIGYKILLEILVKGSQRKITEIPYTFKDRINGKSNLNMREIYNYLLHIQRLKKERSLAQNGIFKLPRSLKCQGVK